MGPLGLVNLRSSSWRSIGPGDFPRFHGSSIQRVHVDGTGVASGVPRITDERIGSSMLGNKGASAKGGTFKTFVSDLSFFRTPT